MVKSPAVSNCIVFSPSATRHSTSCRRKNYPFAVGRTLQTLLGMSASGLLTRFEFMPSKLKCVPKTLIKSSDIRWDICLQFKSYHNALKLVESEGGGDSPATAWVVVIVIRTSWYWSKNYRRNLVLDHWRDAYIISNYEIIAVFSPLGEKVKLGKTTPL